MKSCILCHRSGDRSVERAWLAYHGNTDKMPDEYRHGSCCRPHSMRMKKTGTFQEDVPIKKRPGSLPKEVKKDKYPKLDLYKIRRQTFV